MEFRRPLPLRIALLFVVLALTGVGYALLSAVAIQQQWSHHELLSLAVRFVVLLPVIIAILRLDGGNTDLASDTWNLRVHANRLGALALLFIVGASSVSWSTSRGLVIIDENAYRFQARILATGHVSAPAPIHVDSNPTTPHAFRYRHHIISGDRWFTKYPLGWPLLLALPEVWGFGWLVTPVLGGVLLILTALVAREVFGDTAMVWSAAITALSPFFLSQTVGRMPHALTGVLVAGATLLALVGVRTRRLSALGGMFALGVVGLHVRPFTSVIAATILFAYVAFALRRERRIFTGFAVIAAIAGTVGFGSILLYNDVMTGDPWLSPYALYHGLDVPLEVSARIPAMLHNLFTMWRFSMQSTLLYTFPFCFSLAAAGIWYSRRSAGVWMLAALFPALVIAHLVQPESSTAVIGERYWFEGYFAVAVLSAGGFLTVLDRLRPSRRALACACSVLVVCQALLLIVAALKLQKASEPYRVFREMASSFAGCDCVVFVYDRPPVFYGEHDHLNGPDWNSSSVVFANDPGPAERRAVAKILRKTKWVVIGE